MSVETKEVNLSITANNRSKQTLDAVAKSISELNKVVLEQADAAKKGELSLDELLATSILLKKAQDDLVNQKNLVNSYTTAANKVGELEGKLKAAITRHEEYANNVSASGVITETHANKLASYARSVEAASSSIAKNSSTIDRLKVDLEAAGADVTDLTKHMAELDRVSASLTPAFDANSASLESFSADMRSAEAETQALKAAEQEAAKTARLFEQTQKRYADAARVRAAEHAAFAQKRADRNAEAAANARIFAQDAAEAKQQRELLALKNQMIARAEKEIAVERQVAEAKKKSEEAARKKAEAERKANEENNIFNSNGRTTLSLLQRIRGEVLGLAAAYVGLNAAIGLGKGSIDAQSSREGIKNQLSLFVGNDKAAIDAEYEYIKAQADRIGLVYNDAAESFTKFAVSAHLAGRSSQEIRYIWEAFAEVGKVANLTTDDMNGVFKALEQIMSKGKIQAEEVRGQLGDRLFGAFGVAAEALKKEFGQGLDKAMKDGLVTADHLLAISMRFREMVAQGLVPAMDNAQARQARLTNAIEDFKLKVADSGFGKAFTDFLIRTTELLKSDDAAKFAQALSDGFSFVLEILEFVVTHLEEIKLLVTLWLGVKGVAAIFAFTTALKAMNFQLTVANGLMGQLQKGVLLIAAAFAGWQIGTYLYEQFAIVRKAGTLFIAYYDLLWQGFSHGAEIAWETVKFIFMEGAAAIANTLTRLVRDILGIAQKGASALGKGDLADQLGRAIDMLTVKTDKWGDRGKKVADSFRKELERIKSVVDDTFSYEDSLDKSKAAPGTGLGAPTPPPPPPPPGGGGLSKEELEKRANAIQEITDALSALDARIGKRNKENLDARLGAIDSQVAPLRQKIRELGGEDAIKYEKELDARVKALKLQEERNFNDELLKEHESLLAKVNEADAKAGRKQKDDLDTRLSVISKSFEQLYKDIDEARVKRIENRMDTGELDMLKARAEEAEKEQIALAHKQFVLDKLKEQEQLVNAELDKRKSLLETIRIQEETGSMSSKEANEARQKVISDTQKSLEELIESAKEFATVNAAMIDPTVLAAYLANLDLLKQKYKETDTEIYSLEQSQKDMADVVSKTFGALYDNIVKVYDGVHSWRDALNEAGKAFARFIADMLAGIAQAIIQWQILNAIKSAGWGFSIGGGAAGAGAAAGGGVAAGFGSGAYNFSGITGIPVMHSGGMVGNMSTSRSANPGWFANAPKYHTGGIIGMQPDEYPAILKRNEEVLTESDPRNILNGGAAAAGAQGGTAPGPQPIAIYNQVDSVSVLESALGSPSGVKVLMNVIRANRTSIKTSLN